MAHRKRTFLTLIDVLVSAGAAVIIFAAWAKLTHQSYADTMLTVGMWTETAIFLVYAGIEWVKPKKHEEDIQPGEEEGSADPDVEGSACGSQDGQRDACEVQHHERRKEAHRGEDRVGSRPGEQGLT